MPAMEKPTLLIALIALQGLSAAFFVIDLLNDISQVGVAFLLSLHLMMEALATIGLILGIAFEMKYLMDLLRRSARLEHNMRVATGALSDVIEEYFREWQLTPGESDVAMFAIKGLSNAEIAVLRQSSEGTVKAHLNAVFRKANVSGRHQLISSLVEDLMATPLVAGDAAAGRPAP